MKMARWVSAAAGAAVLTAGFALPASAAVTDGGGNGNSGVLSVLSGNAVNAPVSAPVNLCGLSLGLLGGANAGCEGGSSSTTVVDNGNNGGGNGNSGVLSLGSGNTVNTPVSAPVNLCGVSAAAGGFANSGCKGGSQSTTVITGNNNGGGNGNSGVASILSGNTVNAPVSAPVNVCGIAAAVLGFANAACTGGSHSITVISPPTPSPTPSPCQTTPPPTCQCTTPPRGHQHTPPPGNQVTPPPGNQVTPPTGGTMPSGAGTVPSTTTVPGTLPITGANILGMLAAAVASVGIGATLVIARRRRHGA